MASTAFALESEEWVAQHLYYAMSPVTNVILITAKKQRMSKELKKNFIHFNCPSPSCH